MGTDFSDGAAGALIETRRLAEGFGPAPVVIHAITCMAESLWEIDADAMHWLDSVSLAAEQVDARAGSPWLVLVHAAEELRASGIVLGSHGRSGYQPLRLGSVTARVSLLAPCPVVIVSARSGWRSTRNSAAHAEGDQRRRGWNG